MKIEGELTGFQQNEEEEEYGMTNIHHVCIELSKTTATTKGIKGIKCYNIPKG